MQPRRLTGPRRIGAMAETVETAAAARTPPVAAGSSREAIYDELRATLNQADPTPRYLQVASAFRNLVQRGQEQGLFDRDLDPEAVAGAYTSCILGAEVQYYQDPRRFRCDGIERDSGELAKNND